MNSGSFPETQCVLLIIYVLGCNYRRNAEACLASPQAGVSANKMTLESKLERGNLDNWRQAETNASRQREDEPNNKIIQY